MLRTLFGYCVLTWLSYASASRWGTQLPEKMGRQLLDISFDADGSAANSTVQVFALPGFNSTSPCIFQGYPGSTADSVVPGPLVVNVPQGTVSVISFGPLNNGAIVALYNQTANNTLTTTYNATYGLASVAFNANGSTSIGEEAYITAGRVDEYNSSDPEHSWNSEPTCLVNVTFVVAPVAPPPVASPAASPAASPSGSPGTPGVLPGSGFLNGLLNNILPKTPCFCTPVINGETTCFNFNSAGSDINCAPNNGFDCTSIAAPAGLFTQEAGPVFQCNAPATAG